MKWMIGSAAPMGVNWIIHPNLSGVGTNLEKCTLYHRDSLGHVMESGEGLKTAIGYDEEQDYSYARASGYFGSKLLSEHRRRADEARWLGLIATTGPKYKRYQVASVSGDAATVAAPTAIT